MLRSRLAGTLIVALWAIPAFANPEDRPTGETQASAATDGSVDFLFGRPHAWVAFTGTWLVPRASGDFFSFLSDQLTLKRADFRTPAFVAAFGIPIARQLDVVGDFEVSSHEVPSEYRRYVKADRSEIQQSTQFGQGGIGVGIRYMPLGRGQTISRFAFVPRRVVPYVGAGLNFGHYNFAQHGEFVDFVDLSIFNSSFQSDGWAVGSQVEAGADLQIWRMLYFNAGIRYVWAHAKLSDDFVGFDGIDLSGLKTSSGLVIVF
jgi:hypothetical protein